MSQMVSGIPSLRAFHEAKLIGEVVGELKSGKEATVYCCRGHPETGVPFFAAKVYRDLQSRRFKNDAVYQEGRVVRGKGAGRNSGAGRAYAKKSKFGKLVQFDCWIGSEFGMLKRLYAAGADVPKPIHSVDGGILMEFIGKNGVEDAEPAPMLHSVTLNKDSARPLFEQVMGNIELFLDNNCIHGDLSRFNMMLRRRRITIIDFPQAVDPRSNSNAQMLLIRDVENVCRAFASYGVDADAMEIATKLWTRWQMGALG